VPPRSPGYRLLHTRSRAIWCEEVKRAAGEAVDPRHGHHVAGGQLAEHPVKLAPVGPRARHLLAVDAPIAASRRPKLLKLAVERLPHGADVGIADEAFSGKFRP